MEGVITRRFNFFFKLFIIWVVLVLTIFLSSSHLRVHFYAGIKNIVVLTIMGLSSISFQVGRRRMSFSDTLEDIVDEKGKYSPVSEKIWIFMSYLSLAMSSVGLGFYFYLSLCKVFGWSTAWATTRLIQ